MRTTGDQEEEGRDRVPLGVHRPSPTCPSTPVSQALRYFSGGRSHVRRRAGTTRDPRCSPRLSRPPSFPESGCGCRRGRSGPSPVVTRDTKGRFLRGLGDSPGYSVPGLLFQSVAMPTNRPPRVRWTVSDRTLPSCVWWSEVLSGPGRTGSRGVLRRLPTPDPSCERIPSHTPKPPRLYRVGVEVSTAGTGD